MPHLRHFLKITSGYSAEEIKVKLEAESMAGVLQKPYSMGALHAGVDEVTVDAIGRNGAPGVVEHSNLCNKGVRLSY